MAGKRITDLAAAAALAGGEFVEVAQLSATVAITAATISAQASDNSFNDSGGGFLTAGFAVGDRVRVSGFGTAANNLLAGVITTLTANAMIIGGTDGDVIVDEAAGASVTIEKWTSRRASSQDIADLGGGGGIPDAPSDGKIYGRQDGNWAEVAASGGSGGGGALIPISRVVVGVGGAAEINFAGISSAYEDLEIRLFGRTTVAADDDAYVRLQFNGDTGANYDYVVENRFGTANGIAATFIQAATLTAANAPASVANINVIEIPSYKRTIFQKVLRSYLSHKGANSLAGIFQQTISAAWRNTAAINSIRMFLASDLFAEGTVAVLYGRLSDPTAVPGGVGGWTLAGIASPAAAANADFPDLGAYDEILVVARNLTASITGVRAIQVSTDNGATFDTNAANYRLVAATGVEGAPATPAIAYHSTNATAARTLIARMTTKGDVKAAKGLSGGDQDIIYVGSVLDINAIRILNHAGGTISGGPIYVYGKAKGGGAGAGAAPYRVGFFFTTALTASEVAVSHTFTEAVTFADDFAGSVGRAGTNPAASFAMDVQKNSGSGWTSVGTITISTAGVFTFVTAGGAVDFAIGDSLRVVGPAVADAAAGVSITLKGAVL